MTRTKKNKVGAFFSQTKSWFGQRKEHLIQTLSAFFEGAGWVAGVCMGNLALFIPHFQKKSNYFFALESLAIGSVSCLASCGTDKIINKLSKKYLAPHEKHEMRWENIPGIVGVFLCNGSWQLTYNIMAKLFEEESLGKLFLGVGAGSAATYTLPVLLAYIYAGCKGQFSTYKQQHFLDDLQSILITFLTSGAFVATSTPNTEKNFCYIYADYGIQPSIGTFFLDCAKSGLLTSAGYIGGIFLIALISSFSKVCLSQMNNTASDVDENSPFIPLPA